MDEPFGDCEGARGETRTGIGKGMEWVASAGCCEGLDAVSQLDAESISQAGVGEAGACPRDGIVAGGETRTEIGKGME